MQGLPADTSSSAEINISRELLNFLYAVKRRRKVVIFTFLLSVLLGGLYFATAARIYESRASLLFIQTQLPMASLDKVYVDPVEKMMDTYRSMVSSPKVLEKAIQAVAPQYLGDLPESPLAQRVEALRKRLRATVPRKTSILEIAYRSKNRDAAKAIVERVVSSFLAYMDESTKKPAGMSLDLLTKEKEKLDDQINAAHQQLLALGAKIGDSTIEEGGKRVSVEGKRLMTLSIQALESSLARQKATVQLQCLEAAIQRDENLRPFVSVIMGAAGQDAVGAGLQDVDSYTLSRMQEELLQDRSQWEIESKRLGPNHSAVAQLAHRIRVKDEFLRNVTRGDRLREQLWSTAKANLDNAAAVEWSTRQAYEEGKVSADKREVGISERELLSHQLEGMYKNQDRLIDAIKTLGIAQQDVLVKTTPFSDPEVPQKAVLPSLSLVVMISLFAGIGGGLLLVYFVEMLDDRFGSLEEMRLQLGDLPALAMIRKLEPLDAVGPEAIHVYARPNDPDTECFRTLRTALAFVGDGARSVVVTSSEPGDGKTTVITNLAAAVAQSAKRTLLIDCDCRRPKLTPMLGLRGERGLSTVLRQQAPVAEILPAHVHAGLMPDLDVLPSGPRAADAAELVSSERFSEVLSWAEARYDYIFIDSPPAFVSDAAIIGRLADGMLLVVRPEKNQRKTVIRTVDTLNTLGVKLLGLVVNHFAFEQSKYYGYEYGYGYGYSYDYGYGHDQEAAHEEAAAQETTAEDAPAAKVRILRRAG